MKNLSILAAIAVVAQPAQAASLSLPPASQWIVQSSDETCRVLRQFGTNDPLVLSFEQVAPRAPMAMLASGGLLHVPALRNRAAVTADFVSIPLAHFVADGAAKTANGHDLLIWRSVNFRPSGKIAGGGASGRRGRGSGSTPVPVDVQQKWRAEAYARERAVTALDLKAGAGGDAIRLETGPMAGAMGALRNCMDKQLRSWGLDPAVERTIVAAPVAQTRPDTWVEFSGASRLSLRSDETAPLTVRLLIDARGKVSDCKAAAPRDGAAFETALCDHIGKSAVLLPARTADGRTVPSYFVTTIRRSQ